MSLITFSRAIMSYLVDQYGNNARLYPKSPSARALVNQRLYFDIGILYKFMGSYYVSSNEDITNIHN